MKQLENQQAKTTRVNITNKITQKLLHYRKTNLNGHTTTKRNSYNEEYNAAKREHVKNPDD